MFNLSTYKLQVQANKKKVQAKRKALDQKKAVQEINRKASK